MNPTTRSLYRFVEEIDVPKKQVKVGIHPGTKVPESDSGKMDSAKYGMLQDFNNGLIWFKCTPTISRFTLRDGMCSLAASENVR